MSEQVRRSHTTGLALLVTGALALAAAACASQGTTSSAGGKTTPAANGGTTAAGSPSTPQSPADTAGSTTPSQSPSSTGASTPDQPSSSSSSFNAKFAVTNKLNDVVTQGGFKFKINAITMPYTPPAGSTFKPSDPMLWMNVDFTVTSVLDKPLSYPWITGLELYDSDKNKYLPSMVGWESLPKNKQFPDPAINPGGSATGEIIFEVPKTAKGYLLLVQGNFFHQSGPIPVIDIGK